ncbi:unnamed protein product [Trichogramma brassicae]|uniref:Uncharacterized protein n=1 Tax=Trichogramma brassicae TaxID=86971 RepID=A0A6H5I5K4_9HYME|nr:unnamed protein product [Trichogramma brassicae]
MKRAGKNNVISACLERYSVDQCSLARCSTLSLATTPPPWEMTPGGVLITSSSNGGSSVTTAQVSPEPEVEPIVELEVPAAAPPPPIVHEDPIMSAIIGRRRDRRGGGGGGGGGQEEATTTRESRRRLGAGRATFFEADWQSRDRRVRVLAWGYADSLAFLLMRNGACYACVLSRGGNRAGGGASSLATVERLSFKLSSIGIKSTCFL